MDLSIIYEPSQDSPVLLTPLPPLKPCELFSLNHSPCAAVIPMPYCYPIYCLKPLPLYCLSSCSSVYPRRSQSLPVILFYKRVFRARCCELPNSKALVALCIIQAGGERWVWGTWHTNARFHTIRTFGGESGQHHYALPHTASCRLGTGTVT